jgi:hypothetical protein
MVRCQTNELIAPISEEGIRADKDRADALLDNGRKGGFDFAFAARIQDYNLLPFGMSAVAAFAARAAGSGPATIIATLRATSSAANAGSLS